MCNKTTTECPGMSSKAWIKPNLKPIFVQGDHIHIRNTFNYLC